LKPTFSHFSCVGRLVNIETSVKNDFIVQKLIIKTSEHSILRCEIIAQNSKVVKMYPKNNFSYDTLINVPYEEHRKKRNYNIYRPIKLSFHGGSRLEDYIAFDAIEMISTHLDVGDNVKIGGNLQISRPDDKNNDEAYENFHMQSLIKLDDQAFKLPKYVNDSLVNIETDVIFIELKEKYKFDGFFVYKRNNIVYTVKYTMSYEEGLHEYFKKFQSGQLLKLFGRYEHYVELIEVDGITYFKNNIIKNIIITGGDLTETIYSSNLFEEKASEAFTIENKNNMIEYDF